MSDEEVRIRKLAHGLNMACSWHTTHTCLSVGRSVIVLCYVESRTYEVTSDTTGPLLTNRVVQAAKLIEELDRLHWYPEGTV